VPLLCGAHNVGSVEPEFLSQIGLQPLSDGRLLLQKEKHEGGVAWRIQGDLSASLSLVALALRELRRGLRNAAAAGCYSGRDGRGKEAGGVRQRDGAACRDSIQRYEPERCRNSRFPRLPVG
jgi:hypothetical protein